MPLSDFPGLSATAEQIAPLLDLWFLAHAAWPQRPFKDPFKDPFRGLRHFALKAPRLRTGVSGKKRSSTASSLGAKLLGDSRPFLSHFGSSRPRDDEWHGLWGPGPTELAGAFG